MMNEATAVLTINLDAVAANFALLDKTTGHSECAAVVKANGYGLGMAEIARCLTSVGAKSFFVALPQEGAELRSIAPNADIYVLHGLVPGQETMIQQHRLIPVLNSLDQIACWSTFAQQPGGRKTGLPAALHLDTGMTRLGLDGLELATLQREPDRLSSLRIVHVMSHLSCADDPDSALNGQQLEQFNQMRTMLPQTTDFATPPSQAPTSMANSSGIFLGRDFHNDMVRPGFALYGGNPTPNKPNPMAQVIVLKAKILQTRDVDSPMTVGYGAAHRVEEPGRIATIPAGYADGIPWSIGAESLKNQGRQGHQGHVVINGKLAPIVGRVSMDLITVDISDFSKEEAHSGTEVELIGDKLTVDDLAAHAATSPYEILTRLGMRYTRAYIQNKNSENTDRVITGVRGKVDV